MNANDTVQGYFEALKGNNGWEAFLSDQFVFASFTSPVKRVSGKEAYLQATKRFYSSIRSVTVKDLIVDGEKACALTHYELQHPAGTMFTSDVAEVFSVDNGKINSLRI